MSTVTDAQGRTREQRSSKIGFVSVLTAFYAIVTLLSGAFVVAALLFGGRYLLYGVQNVLIVIALMAFLFSGLFAAVAYCLWKRTPRSRMLGYAVHVPSLVGSIPILLVGNFWVAPSMVLSGMAIYFLYDEGGAFQ